MVELNGKYNTAKVFTDTIEASAVTQIEHLLDQDFAAGSQIRVMPDVHAGMGCTISSRVRLSQPQALIYAAAGGKLSFSFVPR
jgi:hypothetical protein